ncbi:MAG: HisA/HisF-related TIM barrel protein [Bacteroidota bacterium]|nr:HisA/HisF-related TIM barrel protein [Bacteroidota bacterium]MDP4230596.1 HisA/HisF-related TIM barrel protein [Bacteroidota bacterium]MDP4235631.1 HisA/HisF-related TIM barrel protein [Bacteroidota bacterium]
MLLIIPSITIKDGRCIGDISYSGDSPADLHYDKPEDRARLLRKENAKALHLIFEDTWDYSMLELIDRIRLAVDIPVQISLLSLPEDRTIVKQILQSGIYRLFLTCYASDEFLSGCIHDFSRQKIVVSLPLESVTPDILDRLKNDGLIRVCITLPPEQRTLPVSQLQEVAELAEKAGVRLSLLGGVYSFKELMLLARLEPRFDSVIMGAALEENSFPCQGIWREMEQLASAQGGVEANLWKNPLEFVPHS